MEEEERSDESHEKILEDERKLRHLIDKLVKNKYKEYVVKRVQKFDIFKMKQKGYDKEKEEMLMRKEELKKLYPYRKLRALYGTRLKS